MDILDKDQITLKASTDYPIGDIILRLMKLREIGFTHVSINCKHNESLDLEEVYIKGGTTDDNRRNYTFKVNG